MPVIVFVYFTLLKADGGTVRLQHHQLLKENAMTRKGIISKTPGECHENATRMIKDGVERKLILCCLTDDCGNSFVQVKMNGGTSVGLHDLDLSVDKEIVCKVTEGHVHITSNRGEDEQVSEGGIVNLAPRLGTFNLHVPCFTKMDFIF